MSSLLLVDDQVRMYMKIVDAAKPTTTVIVFNRLTSSLDDIIHQIEALPSRAFTSIGLVQDGTDRMVDYRIVYDQAPCALDNLETEGLASWSPVITFLQSLQSLTGMVTFDFISCLLGANPGFSYAISQISAQLGIVLQASTDMAGNLAQGGNWVQESDAVNIQDVYFTEDIAGYTELLYITFYKPSTGMITGSNTGLVSASGNPVLDMKTFDSATIYRWGGSVHGGISGLVTGSGYTAIASNWYSFAALKSDTTIYAWGLDGYGGISGANGAAIGGLVSGSGYTAIASNTAAFAALKSDKTIYAWGNSDYGGISGLVTGSGYTAIASNGTAFAALKSDTRIYAWGDSRFGGISGANGTLIGGLVTGSGYTAIASHEQAFAALKSNGTIYAWGNASYGGISGLITGSGYTAIASNYFAFAALKSDTTIYAWGSSTYGGIGVVTGSGYTAIASAYAAFAALKSNGTIYAWGYSAWGGIGAVTGSGYTAIASNKQAFAALKSNGTIYTWGSSTYGGISDLITGSGYTVIASNDQAFAALKSNGTIYTWGVSGYGGFSGLITGSGYTAIASNQSAFAALKSNGTIYAWGVSTNGGIGLVTGSGYTSIASNDGAFAAMTPVVAIASSGLACFVKGTRLLSQNGYKPIEQFNHTDLLITSDGRTVDFKLCKTTIAKTDEDTAPYVIQAHAFGHNSPIAPLYLSPTHKVMIKKGVWVSPKDVAETNPLVKRCAIGESVTYYHVKCENYLRDNVIAEGIVSESYGTADAVKGVKDIFKWNSRLGGYTRKGPQALLKNKIL